MCFQMLVQPMNQTAVEELDNRYNGESDDQVMVLPCRQE
jgi:hypothetical protein